MDKWETERLAAEDQSYLWHPFTPMGSWSAPDHEPVILVRGEGAIVWDSRGREYVDGNASIWTNIHGHNHPRINAAIREQLDQVAHTSFLGTTNPPAIELAREIVQLFPREKFGRIFYSDDGSTGIEAALRIVSQYWKLKGASRHIFISFRDAYHGDTAGAASLGAAALFPAGDFNWNFPVQQLSTINELDRVGNADEVAAVVIEPIIQGAAGMKIWPKGILHAVRNWCDKTGALLIADEVMTGFGRTGKMFGCEHESVQPDVYVFAKGLTGGYLPLAITLVSHELFSPFEDGRDATSTLSYGHSYTGNALACAAARASLRIFQSEKVLASLPTKSVQIVEGLSALADLEGVRAVRSIGMIGAIDLGDASSASAICFKAREYGLLTRPIRNTIVLMPPLCIAPEQIDLALTALRQAIEFVITRKKQYTKAVEQAV
jgi:adenosylmethionine-8-amino-7-oxononanoate aminotransferase